MPDPPEITNFILRPHLRKVKIFWKNFDDHGCEISENIIYYRIITERNSEPWQKEIFVPYRTQRVQWDQLKVQMNKAYEVIVTAKNSEGESSKDLVIPIIIGNVTKDTNISK